MSGRWGDRPLGRGDGGYCNQKSLWAFGPFCCAREQQDDTQEQTGHYRCKTPERPSNFRLLDQFASCLDLPSIARRFHSCQYLLAPSRRRFLVPKYSGVRADVEPVSNGLLEFRRTPLIAFVKRSWLHPFCPHGPASRSIFTGSVAEVFFAPESTS